MKKLMALFLFLGCCGEAQAFSIKHDFTVFLGPFNASKTSFTYALTPSEYSVNSEVRTAGIFDTLYPFAANYATKGKIIGDTLKTTDYHYDSKSRFNTRSKKLVYNDKGMPVMRISTKNDKEKKVEIDEDADNKGTTDLQTVFAELALQFNRMKFCDSRMEVFDGKRRFDVIFKDEGQETLKPNKYSSLAGKAAKCSMYIDKLGSEGDDLMWQLTSDRPVYFWLLEDPATQKPFIARVLVEDTPLGRLEVYTHKITVGD